jgi:hypothetical protein
VVFDRLGNKAVQCPAALLASAANARRIASTWPRMRLSRSSSFSFASDADTSLDRCRRRGLYRYHIAVDPGITRNLAYAGARDIPRADASLNPRIWTACCGPISSPPSSVVVKVVQLAAGQ